MTDTYPERSNIETGDPLLFSGKGAVSTAIKLFTFSKFSHIGLAVRIRDPIDALCVLESTTLSDVADVLSGQHRQGVQLVLLSERLKGYVGEVYWRKLHHRFSDEDFSSGLCEFRKRVRGRPYEESNVELIKSAYDGWLGQNTEDLSSLFCSELVAECYQSLGLLPEPPVGLPSNEYTPADFSSSQGRDGSVSDPVNLHLMEHAGARLEPEVCIWSQE